MWGSLHNDPVCLKAVASWAADHLGENGLSLFTKRYLLTSIDLRHQEIRIPGSMSVFASTLARLNPCTSLSIPRTADHSDAALNPGADLLPDPSSTHDGLPNGEPTRRRATHWAFYPALQHPHRRAGTPGVRGFELPKDLLPARWSDPCERRHRYETCAPGIRI